MTLLQPHQNRTQFEITDPLHKTLLTSWCILLGTFSILGNTLVLVAANKYRALKLDKISVTLIKHISFADLCYALLVILVVGWSLIVNEWPLNQILCEMNVYLQYCVALVDINLIWVLSVAKLTCIMSPLRAQARSENAGHVLAALVWVFSNIYPLQCAAMRRPVHFDYRSYRCAYIHTTDVWAWLDPLNIIVFLLVPNIIVIATAVWLLAYAHKMVGIHKQAVMTMMTVSLVFCLSYMPIGVYLVAERWIIDGAGEEKHKDFLYTELYRYGMMLKFLNNSANPLIYYATITSFREFVQKRIFKISTGSYHQVSGDTRSTGECDSKC